MYVNDEPHSVGCTTLIYCGLSPHIKSFSNKNRTLGDDFIICTANETQACAPYMLALSFCVVKVVFLNALPKAGVTRSRFPRNRNPIENRSVCSTLLIFITETLVYQILLFHGNELRAVDFNMKSRLALW